MPDSSRGSDSRSEKKSVSKSESPDSGKENKADNRTPSPNKEQKRADSIPKKGGETQRANKKGAETERKGQRAADTEKPETKGSDTEGREKKESPRAGRGRQREYFKEELRRLRSSLEKEASKIVAPDKKEFTPNIFNNLEPYYNTDTPHFLIETPEQIRHGYVSRQTALGLCDPWIDLQMDIELLPKLEPRIPKGEHKKDELSKKFTSDAGRSSDEEYKRTKQDFYRMELDKFTRFHPHTKPKMKAAYFAYLENNPGSKKAIHQCVNDAEHGDKRGARGNKEEPKDKGDKSKNTGQKNKESKARNEQQQQQQQRDRSEEKKDERRREGGHEKQREPSPAKKRASPEKQREASPEKQREASPEKQREASPEKQKEASPEKQREASPEKQGTKSPEKRNYDDGGDSVKSSTHSSAKN